MLSLHSNCWKGHFTFELEVYLNKENLTLTTPISLWAETHAPIKQIRYKMNFGLVFDMGCSIAFCSDRAWGSGFLEKGTNDWSDPFEHINFETAISIKTIWYIIWLEIWIWIWLNQNVVENFENCFFEVEFFLIGKSIKKISNGKSITCNAEIFKLFAPIYCFESSKEENEKKKYFHCTQIGGKAIFLLNLISIKLRKTWPSRLP